MLTKKQQLYKVKKPKRKKCKECKQLFTPTRDFEPCCSYDCNIKHIDSNLKGLVSHGGAMREKENKKKKKDFKESDKSTLLKLAQIVVNKYIRLRDINKEKCISCEYKFESDTRQIHCSHFRPQGNNQNLRFYTLNMWASCSICNNHLSGNLIPYRIALIDKFGIKWVEKLEANHTTKKYTVEYLQKLIKVFRKKIKLYERKFR